MTRILLLIILSISLSARAEDDLWKDNKLTPSQPFPGRVLGVDSGWGGYRLVIESIGDGEKRYCIAQVIPGICLDYREIRKDDLPQPGVSLVFLNPSVEVDRFSWSMGPQTIGKTFGDKDCLRRAVAMEAERRNRKTTSEADNSIPDSEERRLAGLCSKSPKVGYPQLRDYLSQKLEVAYQIAQAAAEDAEHRKAIEQAQKHWLEFYEAQQVVATYNAKGGSSAASSALQEGIYHLRHRIHMLVTPFLQGWDSAPLTPALKKP